jgi:hypothetical protein
LEQDFFCQLLKNNGWHTVGETKRKSKSDCKKKGVSFVEETSELENHSLM